METGLVAFFITMLLALSLYSYHLPIGRNFIYLTVCAIALLLTRMDQIIIVAPVLLINFILCRQKKLFFKIVFLTFSLCYVPYIIWKLLYYGSVLPNTYYAKLAYKSFYRGGFAYIRTFLDIYPALISILFIVIGLCTRNKKLRIVSLLSLVCFSAVVLYCIYLGGDFMEWRFIAPVAGIVLIVGSMSFTGLIIDLTPQKKYLPFFIYSVYLIFISYQYYEGSLKSSFMVMPGQAQETIKSLAAYAYPPYYWKEIGKSLKKYLPKNTILATPAAGMIPFYYEGPVIDLHGLNNKKIARISSEKSMDNVGHEIYVTSVDKMKELGAQVVIDWPYLRIEKHHKYPDVDALRLTENKYIYLKILDPKTRDYLKKNWQKDMLPEEEKEELDLCELKLNLPAHTPWDYYKCRTIQDVLKINFPQGLNKIFQIDLSRNCNDSYEITLFNGENTVHSFSVSPDKSQCPGMVNQSFYFNLQAPVSHALVKPTGSDGHYSIGSFIINKNEYCK